MDDGVVLETERLLLRRWRMDEAPIHRELWLERDPRVPARRRIDADGRPAVADFEEWIRAERAAPSGPGPLGLLAVERKAEGDVVGYCGLVDEDDGHGDDVELAFELLRRCWGRGYATEASRAVLDWARASGLDRVTASVWEWNTASRRVLAKLGFTETGRAEDAEHGVNVFTAKRL